MLNERDRLIELLEKTFEEQYEKRGLLTAPHTAEYLLANGVVVPPCKVGDTVYLITTCSYKKQINEYTVNKVEIAQRGRLRITVKRIDKNGKPHFFTIEQEAFGKTVFLTREEAEQTLKEVADNTD